MAVTEPANSEPLICKEQTMRYRPYGKTGLKISALSFGCMRLGENQDVNTEVISAAIDKGINYFETTRGYCGGKCQHRTAPGLVGKTEGVIVSGKAGIGAGATEYSFRTEIENQLSILGLSHFKFYQVGWFSWGMMPHLLKRGGILDALRKAKDEGLVHRIGFTGHDSAENFTRCIETGLFDSMTVPYNLINRGYEPTIKRAGELGVGVVAMCPVSGGALAYESQKLKDALEMDMPTTEMALRFVLSNPDVSTACSGMSTMAMLEQNVRTVREFDPEEATFEQMCEGLDRLRETLGDAVCTSCNYCMPCPQKVDIPKYMGLHRNWKCFGLDDNIRAELKAIKGETNQNNCDECGECEEACPNDLTVRDRLKELAELAQ